MPYAAAALDVSPHHHLGLGRRATASRSPVSGAAGVRTCRLVALVVPDPGRAIGSRPLIGPRGEAGSSGWTATSGSLDCPLTWLYFSQGCLKFLYGPQK